MEIRLYSKTLFIAFVLILSGLTLSSYAQGDMTQKSSQMTGKGKSDISIKLESKSPGSTVYRVNVPGKSKYNLNSDPPVPLNGKEILQTPLFQDLFNIFQSQGGNISGGGSSFAPASGQPHFLLDFLMLEPEFKEKHGFDTGELSIFSAPLDPENLIVGYPVNLESHFPEVNNLIAERLSLWKKNSPTTVDWIQKILKNTSIRTTSLRFRYLEDRFIPKELNVDRAVSEVTTASLVIQGYGIFIYSQVWDNFLKGNTSRAGLLIHEALRTIKIEYSEHLSHRTIQNITAHIMLADPNHFQANFLDKMLLTDLWFRDELNNPTEQYLSFAVDQLCKNNQALLSFYEESIPKAFQYYDSQHFAEEEWSSLQTMDKQAREMTKNLEHNSFKELLPAFSEYPTLSEAPPTTLNYWLRLSLDGMKIATRGSVVESAYSNTHLYSVLMNHLLYRKQPWLSHLQNLKNLSPKVCDQSKIIYRDGQLFVMFHDTLIQMITTIFTKPPTYQQIFTRNFNSSRYLVPEADREMVLQVYNEYSGSMVCYDPQFKMDTVISGNLQMAMQNHQLQNCRSIKRTYFPNGEFPTLNRINLK